MGILTGAGQLDVEMNFLKLGAAFAVFVGAILLSGCASDRGHYTNDFRAADAVGQWASEGRDPAVVLDVRDDGTFSAEGWPKGLYCDDTIPQPEGDPDDLWEEIVSFDGTWTVSGRDGEFRVRFLSLGPECRTNFPAVAWTIQGEPQLLRVDLSPLTPSEKLTDDRVLYLRQE